MAQTASEGRYGITKQLLIKLKKLVGISSSTISAPLTIDQAGKLALSLSQMFSITQEGVLQVKDADTSQVGVVKKASSVNKGNTDVPTSDIVFRNTLAYRRNLTAEDDLDDLRGVDWQGIWLNKNVHPIHEPEEINGWYYLVNFGGEFNTQIVIYVNAVYIRIYGGSPTAWTHWVKFTGTAIVPT